VAQLVDAKVPGLISDGVIGTFHWHTYSFWPHYGPGLYSAFNP